MGQRRDALLQCQSLSRDSWLINDVQEFLETTIVDKVLQLQRMGKIYRQLAKQVQITVEKSTIPISLAGDCVSSIGVLAGLQKAGKTPDCLLWLDAHGDFHTFATSQTQYIGGMPLAMLVGKGEQEVVHQTGLIPYSEQQIILSDARDLDPGEKQALEKSRIKIVKLNDILPLIKNKQSIYLHWDTDVINAREQMPALKYHVSPGPNEQQFRQLFKALSKLNLCAISISAWHADKDEHNKTAKACLSLLQDLKK